MIILQTLHLSVVSALAWQGESADPCINPHNLSPNFRSHMMSGQSQLPHVCCGTHMPNKHTYLLINKCKTCLMKQEFTSVKNVQSFKVHSPIFCSEFSSINNRKVCEHSGYLWHSLEACLNL